MAGFNTATMQRELSMSIFQALVGILDDVMQELRKMSDMKAAERVDIIRKRAFSFDISYEEASKLLVKAIKESTLSKQTQTKLLDKIEDIEMRGSHSDINTNYTEIKDFIKAMHLPKEETATINRMLNESIDTSTPMQTISMSPACYNKFMQNLHGTDISPKDIHRSVNQNNEYHITYPPHLKTQIQALVRASKCQINEIDYMPKKDFNVIIQSMARNPASAGILTVKNLSLEMSEKILRESRKTNGLICSVDRQPNGKYAIYCYAGDDAKTQKMTQAKLNNLIAKSAFQLTGKMGESEKIRMQLANKERTKIEDHVYNLNDNPEGGYIFTLRKTKEGYSVPGYIEFDKDKYIYTDRPMDYSRPKIVRRQVQRDQTTDFSKAIMSRATGGDGRHFFISRDEFDLMKQDVRKAMMLIQDDHDPVSSLGSVQQKIKELDKELEQYDKKDPLYNQVLHEKVIASSTEKILQKLSNPKVDQDMTPGLFATEIRSSLFSLYLRQKDPAAFVKRENGMEFRLDKQIASAKEFFIPNTKIHGLRPQRVGQAKNISAVEAGNVFDSIKVANVGKKLFAKLPEEKRDSEIRKLVVSEHEHFQEAKDVLSTVRIEMQSLDYSIGVETIDRTWSQRKREEIDVNIDIANNPVDTQTKDTGSKAKQQDLDLDR